MRIIQQLYPCQRRQRLQYTSLNECVEKGKIQWLKIEGAKNVADIFTKPLARDRFRMLAARMAHSTTLLVPQPMTMDQDGPSYCLALNTDGKTRCRNRPHRQHEYCNTHLLQIQGHICSGTTLAGNPCLAGRMQGSQYCDKHGRGRSRGMTVVPLDNLGIPLKNWVPNLLYPSPRPERVRPVKIAHPDPYSIIKIIVDGKVREIRVKNTIG